MITYLDSDTLADIPDTITADIPEDEAMIEEWTATAPKRFEGILEAEPVDTLAPTLASAILLGAWLYDRRTGTYTPPKTRRKPSPRPVKEGAIADLVSERVKATAERLDKINSRYQAGKEGLDDWFNLQDDEIQALHTELFILGRGGIKAMDRDARDMLHDLLRFQRWKLSEFHGELIVGTTLSPAQIAARSKLYAESAKQAYVKGRLEWAKAEKIQARRYLNPLVKEHCRQCPEYATAGFVSASRIVAPGVACDCMANCKCLLEFKKR
jgi:hypothetical protein